MALECWVIDATVGPLLEVFWRDSDGEFRFTAFGQNLAFELVESFVESARQSSRRNHLRRSGADRNV